MISIIIPTLNEEKNIKTLLAIIQKGGFDDYEVIIADAGSIDKTIEIARKNNCIISKGGLPARGRNIGAKIAKGDILFFLDADLKFYPKNFLKLSVDYFTKNDLSVASFAILPQKNNIYMNPFTLNLFYNIPQELLKKVFPMGAMGIMVKKDVFEKVKGFDESITLAEDHYFVQQANKFGKFDIIKGVKIYMPLRRFEKDGYFRTSFKYLICAFNMGVRRKPERKIRYDFGHYDKK
ncbi:MAG TPA: glycosyltransferase [Candidatus Pacearchaeota archaeon]|nr:glycosyltransferase [Candidatus Pacearchaeota archaeon]HPR79897.1 glycosyltransferase [Candidatus Pacearchaeota archaeon]